jgi:hypothetical protein
MPFLASQTRFPGDLVARIHRLQGLRYFVLREPEKAITAFGAARSIEPSYRFPESLVPAGNPVLADYGAIDVTAERPTAVVSPATGHIQFDGRPGTSRPSLFPTIFQRFDDQGVVVDSKYLWPADALPTYDVAKSGAAAIVEPGTAPRRGAAWPWFAGAGAAALASGLMYGLAVEAAGTYRDPRTGYDDLDGLRREANGLSIGAIAAGGVAVGATVIGVVAVRW